MARHPYVHVGWNYYYNATTRNWLGFGNNLAVLQRRLGSGLNHRITKYMGYILSKDYEAIPRSS
jgi:hypothetical protein